MKGFFGEHLYRLYIVVLKLVITIVPTISAIMVIIKQLILPLVSQEGLTNFIVILTSSIITTYFIVMIRCAIAVTLVFVILKLFNVEIWEEKLEDLENILQNKHPKLNSISRVEASFELVGILIILWFLCLHPELIAAYQIENGNLMPLTSLFNQNVLAFYHPLILGVYGFGFLLGSLKLLIGQWSIGLAVGNLVYKGGAFLLLSSMLINQSLFNKEFFITLMPFTTLNLMDYWSGISYMTLIIVAIVTFFEVISPFIKALRSV